MADLTAQYLKKIGLDVTVKQIDSTLLGTKGLPTRSSPSIHVEPRPRLGQRCRVGQRAPCWSTLVADWVTTGGKQGVEPPDWAKKAFEIDARRWQAVSGSDEYKKIVAEGTQWTRDNLPYINFVENVKYPMVASAKLGNVGQSGFAIGANFAGEQMFFK